MKLRTRCAFVTKESSSFGNRTSEVWTRFQPSERNVRMPAVPGMLLCGRAVSEDHHRSRFVLFQVVHDANTLYIFAPSPQSRDRWVKKLKEGKNRCVLCNFRTSQEKKKPNPEVLLA